MSSFYKRNINIAEKNMYVCNVDIVLREKKIKVFVLRDFHQ